MPDIFTSVLRLPLERKMLAGLVYCEVDRNNSKTTGQNDREVVAEGLENVIPTISPVMTGTYSSPETTYCNDTGRGILSRLQKMEEKVNWLEALEAEVVMIRPLWKTAVGIRARFFATSQVQAGMGGIGLQASIDDGNEISVRYGASGALKITGPRPHSSPRPAHWPGAGCFSRLALPRYPPGAPPRPCPRLAPRKFGWKETGPRPGKEWGGGPDGGGVGGPTKYPPGPT
ncbi:hypothetical protein HOY80DRAFT_653761 [Tuber brumale]|nr:hypothetical protein HOY80DRAFT_653761 [Tuber brumale]